MEGIIRKKKKKTLVCVTHAYTCWIAHQGRNVVALVWFDSGPAENVVICVYIWSLTLYLVPASKQYYSL